ncbi:type II toxin-antitoxin system MqsR family toxin [Komagataeibacter sp. NFXK3]
MGKKKPHCGGMEKLKPHYDLTDIKSAFADPSQLNRTFVATQGAQRLGLVSQQIVDVIQSLAHSDFDKSTRISSVVAVRYARVF